MNIFYVPVLFLFITIFYVAVIRQLNGLIFLRLKFR